MFRKFINLLTHPVFIAALLFLLALPFIPVNYSCYLFQEVPFPVEKLSYREDQKVFFADMDSDGNSEVIRLKNNAKGSGAFVLYNDSLRIVDQYNFDRMKLDMNTQVLFSRTCVRDFDENGKKELYCLGTCNDSVFLRVEEPLNHHKVIINRMFITTVDLDINKNPSFRSDIFGLYDMNGDHFKDFVFSIYGNFNINKRFVAWVDLHNQVLHRTRNLHFPSSVTEIKDVDGDGKNEIFLFSMAPNNADTTVPYPDTKDWFIVLNDTLGFKYPPLSLPSHYGNCASLAIGRPGKYTLVADYFRATGVKHSILFYDPRQSKLRASVFRGNVTNATLVADSDKIQLLVRTSKGKYFLLSDSGSRRRVSIDYAITSTEKRIHGMQFRGKTAYFLSTENPNGLLLVNKHFKKLAFLNISQFTNGPIFGYFWKLLRGRKTRLLVYGNKPYLFNIKRNPFYYTWPLVYLAVYGLILGLVLLLSYSQKQRLKRKQEQEKQMLRLQLITIKGQMRPHFIFNALNSIMANINLGQYDIAYKYLGKFSRLLRLLYSEEEKLSVTLAREMEFVENYLEIEHLRFKEKLSFEININEKANLHILIPRMLVQIFVENAIKHGLRKSQKPGHLKIEVYPAENGTEIIIEDNGIGREAAGRIKEPFDSTGYGLKVVNDMIAMHKHQTGIEVTYQYVDLFTEQDEPAGTKVIVKIADTHTSLFSKRKNISR